MLVKINDFGYNSTITDPISELAELLSVTLTANGTTTNFDTIVSNEVSVTYLADDELEDLNVKYNVSDGATITVNDTDLSNRIVTVTSESGTVTNQYTVTFEAVTDMSTGIVIYSISDSNDTDCVMYYDAISEQYRASVPYFDNSVKWFELTTNTNYPSTTDIEYISFDGVEPDGDNTFGITLTAFDGTEELILDSNFVYLKLTRGVEHVYVQLDKADSLTSNEIIDNIKKTFNDKWCQLFFNRILTELIVNPDTLKQLETAISITALKELLDFYNIEWFDIEGVRDYLVDDTATNIQYAIINSQLMVHNAIEYTGLTSYGIERLDKSIAKWLYDELSVSGIETTIPNTLTYLLDIWNDDFVICSEDRLKAYNVMMQSEASVNILLACSTRLLKTILIWFQYVQMVHQHQLARYEVDDYVLSQSIYLLTKIIDVKTTYQFDAVTMTSVTKFLDSIQYLKKQTEILSIGDWN